MIGDYLKGLRYQLVERACETMNSKVWLEVELRMYLLKMARRSLSMST